MAPLITIVHLNDDASFITITNRNRLSLLMRDNVDFTIKGPDNLVADSRIKAANGFMKLRCSVLILTVSTASCFKPKTRQQVLLSIKFHRQNFKKVKTFPT